MPAPAADTSTRIAGAGSVKNKSASSAPASNPGMPKPEVAASRGARPRAATQVAKHFSVRSAASSNTVRVSIRGRRAGPTRVAPPAPEERRPARSATGAPPRASSWDFAIDNGGDRV